MLALVIEYRGMNKTDKALPSRILVGNTENKEINYENCYDGNKRNVVTEKRLSLS